MLKLNQDLGGRAALILVAPLSRTIAKEPLDEWLYLYVHTLTEMPRQLIAAEQSTYLPLAVRRRLGRAVSGGTGGLSEAGVKSAIAFVSALHVRSVMVVYSFYVFDRHGRSQSVFQAVLTVTTAECIYKKHWTPRPNSKSLPATNGFSDSGPQPKALSAEDDAKLVFGTIFSLRNMVRKLGGPDDK